MSGRGGAGLGYLVHEVQCIMGNGHIGTPVDKDTYENIPATWLAGGKKETSRFAHGRLFTTELVVTG